MDTSSSSRSTSVPYSGSRRQATGNGHYHSSLDDTTTTNANEELIVKNSNGSNGASSLSPKSSGPSSSKNTILSFEIETVTNDLYVTTTSASSASNSLRKRQSTSKIDTFCRAACHHVQSQWAILLAGQILSFLMACSGAAQATLSFDCDLSAPTLSLFLFYFCLAFCLVPMCRENAIRKHTQQITIDLNRQYETASQARGVNSPIQNQQQSRTTIPSHPSSTSLESIKTYPFLFGLLTLSTPAYVYFFMAILDVYANYFTVLAFKYTTITSVTLLDALAIPSAMVLSRAFLKRDYSRVHLAGALLCMVGVVLNVLQDYEDDKHDNTTTNDADTDPAVLDFPYKVKGDILATLGGILFGASSVVGEVAVRDLGGPNEYVGMLGFFCALICFVQTIVLEMDDVAEFLGRKVAPNDSCSQATSRILLVAFVIIMVINYLGRAWFLQVSEAAFLNLSLLTGDMWSVLFSVFAEKIAPHAFFYVALTITLSGVFVYEMAPSPIHDMDLQDVNQNASTMIDQESDDELDILDDDEDAIGHSGTSDDKTKKNNNIDDSLASNNTSFQVV
jgi:solute carrier family 35, member F1/2